jgi:hypothetical protein
MDAKNGQYNLADMVDIHPFLEIGMTKEETEPVLLGIFTLLQVYIDNEISENLNQADEELIKDTFDADDYVRISIAYDETYKARTGRSLEDFSKTKLQELIQQSAQFLAQQKEYIAKLAQFDETNAKEFIELVNQEKYEEAEKMMTD